MCLQFGHTMEELKESDSQMRKGLSALFRAARDEVAECVRLDKLIARQLQQEEGTKNYEQKIQTYLNLLQQAECPLVMAGKTSKIIFFRVLFVGLFFFLQFTFIPAGASVVQW